MKKALDGHHGISILGSQEIQAPVHLVLPSARSVSSDQPRVR
jgi:hypothetical protein